MILTISLLGFSGLQEQQAYALPTPDFTISDQASCEAVDGVWTEPNICNTSQPIQILSGETLTIDSGIIVKNSHGMIMRGSGVVVNNFGTLDNLHSFAAVNGVFNNFGTLNNFSQFGLGNLQIIFNNSGTFNNYNVFVSSFLSIVHNSGTFNNFGSFSSGSSTFHNPGTIYNSCEGTIDRFLSLTSGNPVVQEFPCDTESPVITLNGANPQELLMDELYIELGATVTDNSGEIIIPTIDASLVDVTMAGDYLVSYDAIDSSDNVAITVFRTVTVLTQVQAVDNLTEDFDDAIASEDIGDYANGLLAKLDQIMNKLDDGNTNAACNQLGAFINQLDGIINNGTPEEIAAVQPILDAVIGIQSSYC